MPHHFFVWKEPGVEDRILVWDTRTLSIGRSSENDLTLEDEEISRQHAVLARTDAGWEVQDYRTGNGTFVGGERVQQTRAIRPGDSIRIGKLELVFRESDEHPAKLGLRLEFASQLKTVGRLPGGADAGATMLGLGDTAPPEEDFVVEPERSSGENAFVAGPEGESEFQMMELEDSLNDMELDLGDDGLGGGDLPPPPETRPLDLDPGAPASPARAPGSGATAGGGVDPMERLRTLKQMRDEGLITDEEFEAKRAEILARM